MWATAPADLSRRLPVIAADRDNPRPLPVPGRIEFYEDEVCFVPRFPFIEGVAYTLLVSRPFGQGGAATAPEAWTIDRPVSSEIPSTEVAAFYPSGTEAPANLARLHIQFTAPMSEGLVQRSVSCRRVDGRRLEGLAFREGAEIWDRERRRLTLELDVGPHVVQAGAKSRYRFTPGVPFMVVVEEAFLDGAGLPLRGGAMRRYEVGPAVTDRVDPKRWRLRRPRAGSKEPLSVDFDRPLDHALLEHGLWVYDAAGMPLAGRSFPGSGEWSWHFEPHYAWKESGHAVNIDPRLEDLAGNSLVRAAGAEKGNGGAGASGARPVQVPFNPGAAS